MAKAKVTPKKLKVCGICWDRLHTQYNEKSKEKKVLDYCPIEVHVRAAAGEKCEARDHRN